MIFKRKKPKKEFGAIPYTEEKKVVNEPVLPPNHIREKEGLMPFSNYTLCTKCEHALELHIINPGDAVVGTPIERLVCVVEDCPCMGFGYESVPSGTFKSNVTFLDVDHVDSAGKGYTESVQILPIRTSILVGADEAINADRDKVYGSAQENFDRTAKMLSACGFRIWSEKDRKLRDLNGVDISVMMVVTKVSRLINSPDHQDSWMDAAGYSALGAELSKAGVPYRSVEEMALVFGWDQQRNSPPQENAGGKSGVPDRPDGLTDQEWLDSLRGSLA